MGIHIEKVGLIRLNPNPKNKQLTLNLDWSVDYENTDQKVLNYDCILKNYGSFDIKLKVEGTIILEEYEKFQKELFSQILVKKSSDILMEMINLTRQNVYEIKNENETTFSKAFFENQLIN